MMARQFEVINTAIKLVDEKAYIEDAFHKFFEVHNRHLV